MQLRRSNIRQLAEREFDVLIVGGGINGASAAAALSGKGVSVALIDRGDFAGSTSMHSSNLVWGGIKYMESRDFALVRKLCKSRNHLIKSYPSTVQEIRFLTTISRGFRYHPRYLWAGAWLYWLIGNAFTRIPRFLSPRSIKAEEPIVDIDGAVGGFEYSDAYLHDNDARFVFNFVRGALDFGATAANYVESLGARREDDGWVTDVRDRMSGETFTIRSKVMVNAAGPWVDELNSLSGQATGHQHVFSKGIHLIVPRLTKSGRVLAFFADDGRLFFVIPMGARTCIGTTDTRVEKPEVGITEDDIRFVLDNINKRLSLDKPLGKDDIIATRCGVRPLAVKASSGGDRDFLQLSRKHAIDIDAANRHLSIFGGKLTDCLNVGEEIVEEVRALGIEIPDPEFRWYGEPDADRRDAFMAQAHAMQLDELTADHASEPLSTRLWRRYGDQAMELLEDIRRDPRQGEVLIEGTEYLRCELAQASRREMITRLEDFLRRRSKISLVVREEVIRQSPGLHEACELLFGDQAEARLHEYLTEDNGALEEALSPGAESDNPAHSETLRW
ncbi:glycerol-3-phosphate dehydrogenase/oxidase [Halomonas urumqiensis]|uniref:FAD-dependent oxidoreductase n=1 Tax=Halomonas urumqiensis TaxID=1684789 RepID=A0A2N7UKU0_9GAMM|nr:glycerol-3-phosphate dehydrogenase/oxidase [Halomonas urumqiensis]PMR81028.1 FAD-dependent oxidoreductase [Halomonas urumqiensis]PTB01115.1 glycerol-3-phosphate dehydrogenase/oxidase [Halomonas urumqiensis]GHE22844.1 FAD-dependent oxidoreductase [Halomonas urumqiensis]